MPAFRSNVELLTLKQAARLSPYSADYLNLLARKGKIRATKLGRDWLLTKADLFSYLARQQRIGKSRQVLLNKYISLF